MIRTDESVNMKTLLFFFIPLGFSATLITLSHIIINSTLVKAEHSEYVIACYTIAMSLFGMIERLGGLLRQTCSTLVRDKYSFKLMAKFTAYLLSILMFISIIIANTSVGNFIFLDIFGVKSNMVSNIKGIYQILIYVTIFSTLRCLNQGIIIYNRQTKWLTIGMGIRLSAMYLLWVYFVHIGNITGKTGAYIFLLGMMIECFVSFIEARKLVRKMPEKHEQRIESKSYIFKFYSPLMFSSLIIVMVGPAINVFLGKTSNMELAIASFAIAQSVTQLFLSFFSYVHQIVINFYDVNKETVKKFTLIIGFVPGTIVGLFSFTPLGQLFLENIMGVHGRLLDSSLEVLKIFMLMALIFPFVDFFNGLLMVHKHTKVTIISQSSNLIITFISLVIGITFVSQWNGMIGALAQSLGLLAELIVVGSIVNSIERPKEEKSFLGNRGVKKQNIKSPL